MTTSQETKKATEASPDKQTQQLFQENGKDYVVTADNHPEVMANVFDDIIDKMSGETEAKIL